MTGERLDATEIQGLMASWPEDSRRLGLAARALVLGLAPGLDETIAFHALCYYRRDAPYGVIGGNVCLVDEKHEKLHLSFLHGAFLPDPDGLLTGKGKSKRDLRIMSEADLANPAVAALIRAAIAYDPAP